MDKNLQLAQARLISLGYDLGKEGADGLWGTFTTDAIAKFQADHAIQVKHPGTLGPKTITTLNAMKPGPSVHADLPSISLDIVPPHVAEARRRIGLQEKRDNRTLSEYLASDGSFLGDPSKFPWCGDFMQTVIALTLKREPLPANPFYALNWQKFGVPVAEGFVPLGAIITVERRNASGDLVGGHVGLVVGHDQNYFHVLGGNESNMVTIVKIAKDRRRGPLRYPSTLEMPEKALPFSDLNATISNNEA